MKSSIWITHEYYPISAKDQSRIHQFGKKVFLGLFLGYAMFAGGIWKGDILVADIEELENLTALEIHPRRFLCKGFLNAEKWCTFQLPKRRWNSEVVWRRSGFWKSTSKREQPVRGEELSGDLRGESDGSQPIDNDAWQKSPKLFLVDRRELHLSPSRWTKSSALRAEGRIILNTTAILLRGQENTQHTNLDVLQESWTDDYQNIMVGFHAVHNNEWIQTPSCYLWSRRRRPGGGGSQTFKQPHGLVICGQKFGLLRQKQLNEGKSSNGLSRNRSSTAHESTRQRLERTLPEDHEDHIAERGSTHRVITILRTSSFLCSKPMRIPDTKAAVDEEWGEARETADQANDQSQEQNGSHPRSTKRPKESLGAQIDKEQHQSSQKFEVGSEVSKVMVVIARVPDCSGQAADAESAYHPNKNGRRSQLLKIPESECPDFWLRLPRHKWPKSWSNIEDLVECMIAHRKQGFFLSFFCGRHHNGWKEAE